MFHLYEKGHNFVFCNNSNLFGKEPKTQFPAKNRQKFGNELRKGKQICLVVGEDNENDILIQNFIKKDIKDNEIKKHYYR